MSVTVTLHIFSGMPNPSWELNDKQIAELVSHIHAASRLTLLKPPGVAGGLGYRGFSITSVRQPQLDPDIYVHAGIVDLDRFNFNRIAASSELEMWLLSTAGAEVDAELRNEVADQLTQTFEQREKKASEIEFFTVPPYDPGKWNNDPSVRIRNNCYNYANDKITNSFAQPGRGSGQIFNRFDCGNVAAAAERDGQVPVSSASSTPVQGHFIALVVWPGRDYHWYRLDNNAMWSHKAGDTAAANTDNSNRTISDPRNCDRGHYTEWCGFYHCIPVQTRIN